MKLLPVLAALLLASAAYSQKITVDSTGSALTVRMDKGKYCKQLYIQYRSLTCSRQTVFYTPFYECKDEVKKPPVVSLKDELLTIRKMLDTAEKRMKLDLCQFVISPADYDDVLVRMTELFCKSEDWKKHIDSSGLDTNTTVLYNKKLAAEIMENSDMLAELDKLLKQFGYKIATLHVNEDDALIPEETLLRLKKDKNLRIPLPDQLWMQLVQNK
jgi:hypothetical protein